MERVDGEARLARPGDAGDAGERAERDLRADVLQVVGAGAFDADVEAVALAPLLRHLDPAGAGEVLAGEAVRVVENVLQLPLRDDLAAVDARAGAEIDDMVGGADGVLVMLDHDDGVAEIAQALERDQQAVIVALVEADGGLVEHVEHAREARADLAGEADALAFAARQGAGGAIEVEVIEADVVEEAEALVDFLEDGLGDLRLLAGELGIEFAIPCDGGGDREVGDGGDVGPGDLDAERFGFEAGAVAGLAGLRGLVLAELLAHPRAFGLQHAAVEIADHAFERLGDGVALLAVDEGERDGLAAGAIEDDELHLARQFVPRGFKLEAEVRGEAGENLHVIGRRRVGLGPGDDGALLERKVFVGDDELRIEQQLFAEAIAGGARALRGVEREQAGFERVDGEAADRAGELFGEDDAVGREAGFLHAGFGFGRPRGGGDLGRLRVEA